MIGIIVCLFPNRKMIVDQVIISRSFVIAIAGKESFRCDLNKQQINVQKRRC